MNGNVGEYEPKYWNHKGRYQSQYDIMVKYCEEDIIPLSQTKGRAKTMDGELLRCASNIYHRRFNDGDEADMHSYDFRFVSLVGGDDIGIGIGMSPIGYDNMMDKVIEFIITKNREYTNEVIAGEIK